MLTDLDLPRVGTMDGALDALHRQGYMTANMVDQCRAAIEQNKMMIADRRIIGLEPEQVEHLLAVNLFYKKLINLITEWKPS